MAKYLNLQLITSRRFAPGSRGREEKKGEKGWLKRKKQEETAPPRPPESEGLAEEKEQPLLYQESFEETIETDHLQPEENQKTELETESREEHPEQEIIEESKAVYASSVDSEEDYRQEQRPDNPQESMAAPNPFDDYSAGREEATAHSADASTDTTTGKTSFDGQSETLQEILALESGATMKTAAGRELKELKRRRHEVMRHLHDLRTSVEQEREALEAKAHFFSTLLNDLQDFPEEIDESALRHLRQAVNSAHIECVKFEQEREQKAEVRNQSEVNYHLASLSFGQLSRIGGALFWPLIAALLLAGGTVAITIYIIFRI